MDKPLLKIGELATRAGLTVRTLHHYDSIGLLTPSARAASGYRLYNSTDAARLHQIQALRHFGMSLTDISTLLASPEAPFADLVAQQVAALDRQIQLASALRARLCALQQNMSGDTTPAMEDWLSTLEHMHVHERHFTQEELRHLPYWQHSARSRAAWTALIEEVYVLMERGLPAASPQAGALALRWMTMLEQDTAANADIAARLTAMMEQEPSAQRHTGITPALRQYVSTAFALQRAALYAKYLDADEMQQLAANSAQHLEQWMALVAAVHCHMASGAAPEAPRSRELAQEWIQLFHLRAGDDPVTLAKIRNAHENEPALLQGTWVNVAMLAFIRSALA